MEKLPHKSFSFIKSKVKTYPDGSKKITVFKEPLVIVYGTENAGASSNDLNLDLDKFSEDYLNELERIKMKRIREVKNKIKDYILSNEFTHFWNITQDEKVVGDRLDDEIALKNLKRFLQTTRERAKLKGITFGYVFVPERHKNGALHFHGFTFGYPYEFVDSGHTWKGKPVYNCKQWKKGFTNVTEIQDKIKASNYITKYLTKEMLSQDLGKGKKKYWCSKGLKLPEIEYLENNVCEGMKADWTSPDGNIMIYNIKN
ncbi:hypothetical protein ERX35_011190 [Macrococcus equipercicus]|uniref:Replication-associated protein ORF2/G2P domain-containing protein n=1 Tax=Macrococcus equipercicus TaxID=69967 RepID=A0ABQ6R620_9STAP|nr:hypothetical protein [Macrococcus equipercicus]KAA1035161.1 hypothetical protein ERX35_011190 [Macrococcus equipercicus]